MQTDTHDWVLLSNRLLLVQEVMVGLGQLSPTELVQRSAEGLTWIFDGGTLHALSPDEVTPPPRMDHRPPGGRERPARCLRRPHG